MVVVFCEDDKEGEWVEAVGTYDCVGRGGVSEWGFE
jgi:hypothetical protein